MLWGIVSEGEVDMILLGLLFIPWMAAPVAAAAGCAAASPTRAGALAFLALEAAMILSFGWVFVEVFYIHPSSTGGIAFVVWPLAQWIAWVVVMIVAHFLGWRERTDRLEE